MLAGNTQAAVSSKLGCRSIGALYISPFFPENINKIP
jgi:hypothetical protein